MFKPALAAAALLLLTACATTEPVAAPDEPVAQEIDNSYAAQIERAANARIAREPAGALPSGLEVAIESVEEVGADIFYKVQILTAKNRRREQDYVLYGQCAPAEIDACADQIVAAARMLEK